MNIISQLQEFISNNISNIFEQCLEGTSFTELVGTTEKFVYQLGRLVIESGMKIVEDEIDKHPARKQNWHIERRNDKKTISTVLGDVTYSRTYYCNKKNQSYAYLCDNWFGIGKHERMDTSLKTAIVEKATDLSYQKTIDSFPKVGISSKTTVMNIIRRIGLVENDAVPIPFQKKQIKTLFIEADEDHISMQHENGRIGKIAYVHEGLEAVSNKRKKLINTRYFTGVDIGSEDFWIQVSKYLDEAYNMDTALKVYLSGDGASWIKEGLNWIPKAEFVLDRYHLSKYIKMATAHELGADKQLRDYIAMNLKKDATKLFNTLIDAAEDEKKKESIKKAKAYILRNWKAIQRQQNPDYVGCSAESHVSHVLSARLSSRPMGWSVVGADQMAHLRSFVFNGGNIMGYLKISEQENHKAERITKLDKKVLNSLKKNCIGNLGNIPVFNYGKTTSLSKFLRFAQGF
ncbi:MAG: ISLre2 family transposase [Bacillota bacterium]